MKRRATILVGATTTALFLGPGCTGVGPFDPGTNGEASLTPANPVLRAINETVRLQLTVGSATDIIDDQAVDWASSNPSVATVDDAGVVRAMGDGSATITAEWNGIEAATTATVDATITYTVRLSGSNPPDANPANNTVAADVTVTAN